MAKKATKKAPAKPVAKNKVKVIAAPAKKKEDPEKKGKGQPVSKVSKNSSMKGKANVEVSKKTEKSSLKIETTPPQLKSPKPVSKTEEKVIAKAESAKTSKATKQKNEAAKVIKIESAAEEVPSKRAKKYEGATEEESRWLELQDKHRNIKALPYKMSGSYLEKTPIEHKVLGWGFVLSVINDRLEVLFRSGIKHLISNYKTNN